MAGVTKEEIALAKELDLLTYFKLVEPGNLKLVGKEYRHKVHSSLTISKDSLWCWHCIGLRGRTALKYLIDVEKIPYVDAVREINRIQGGAVHSSQPVSLPQPRAEPEAPRDFKLPNDNAGRTRTQDIIAHLAGSGKAVEDRPPPVGKDYNDTLVQYMQEYRAHCISMDDILEETR